MRRGVIHRLDLAVAHRLNDVIINHRKQIRFLRLVSMVGGPTSWRALTAVTAGTLLLRRRRRPAYQIALTMAGAALLSGGTKELVGRSRPALAVLLDRPAGKSFPSGHALTSFVAVGVLVRLLWPVCTARRRALLLIGGALTVTAIGFSRLALGVHFLTDVLGGWLLGALWLLGVRRMFERSRRS
jgi:undecaprenyl-diphosphatase